MKTIPTDIIVCIGLAIVLILATQFELIRSYYAFSFVPLFGMYLLGKYIGNRGVKNEFKNFQSKKQQPTNPS